jgi:ABC-type glycerol-3-phosphate transport system substrate-binding protein
MLSLGLTILLVIAVYFYRKSSEIMDYSAKYAGTDLDTDVETVSREGTYEKYLSSYAGAACPDTDIDVDIFNISQAAGASIENDCDGKKALLLTDSSKVTFSVNVAEAGFYNLYFCYYPLPGRGVTIERAVYINGVLPFTGSDDISFERVWGDANEPTYDNQGNEIRASQTEIPSWQYTYAKDPMGYEIEPYEYYFSAGENTITFEAVNEPVALASLTLSHVRSDVDYEKYCSLCDSTEYSATDEKYTSFVEKVQGEDSTDRSSASLYPTYDRSSSITEPYSAAKIKLNMIGGSSWKVSGQWIEWQIEVPEDGFYEITLKARQNYTRGFVSNRSLYIDGSIPFKEVSEISFKYSNEWNILTLSDENGTPYKFALTKGTHTIRLQITLGSLGKILNQLEDSVYRLNNMYRRIIVLTGTSPDKFRDYKIDSVYPDVMTAMGLESKRLYRIVDEVIAYTGQKASQIAAAQTLAKQLEKFVKRPDKIALSISSFNTNISSLGTSILSLSESPLDIDYICVSAATDEARAKLPDETENFWKKAAHETRSFIASFTQDYNSLGNVYDTDDAIEVWMLAGRDQSTILKTMIDDTFTPESGITVNVKLVDAATLLPATVAGTGPDVALSVQNSEPVNYALRNAAADLTQFEGFEDVISHYYESAYIPYELEGGIYAIPETQNFNVMFYRKDILSELGLEPPETWEDLIDMLPVIQQNNMTVAIPTTERKINNVAAPDMSNFFDQLYQHSGTLYDAEGMKTLIDDNAGVEAFEIATRFFTDYKLPTTYDFVNRFRSGEMPIGIQSYNTFNTLVVFAPEIRGLWDFTLVPGTVKEDGSIDHSVSSWGTCSMMLEASDKKDSSWTFLQWWSKADTQIRFGRELEAVMGESARYATANIDAFEGLSWSGEQMKSLEEQWKWAVGTPEVPGSYYTSRHIVNAIRKVMNDLADPRETLLDYARTINEELTKKRLEFGLPVASENDLENTGE